MLYQPGDKKRLLGFPQAARQNDPHGEKTYEGDPAQYCFKPHLLHLRYTAKFLIPYSIHQCFIDIAHMLNLCYRFHVKERRLPALPSGRGMHSPQVSRRPCHRRRFLCEHLLI